MCAGSDSDWHNILATSVGNREKRTSFHFNFHSICSYHHCYFLNSDLERDSLFGKVNIFLFFYFKRSCCGVSVDDFVFVLMAVLVVLFFWWLVCTVYCGERIEKHMWRKLFQMMKKLQLMLWILKNNIIRFKPNTTKLLHYLTSLLFPSVQLHLLTFFYFF